MCQTHVYPLLQRVFYGTILTIMTMSPPPLQNKTLRKPCYTADKVCAFTREISHSNIFRIAAKFFVICQDFSRMEDNIPGKKY
jgi:hypothetical protein